MPRRTIDMLAFLMQHDAHHRGQIGVLAGDLGHSFSGDDKVRLWGWKAIRCGRADRDAGNWIARQTTVEGTA